MSEKTLKIDRPNNFSSISNIGNKYIPILESLIDFDKYFKRLSAKDKKLKVEFRYESYKMHESINELHPHKNCGEVYFVIVDENNDEYGRLAGFKFAETTNCCGSMSSQEKFANLSGCGVGRLLEYMKEDIFKFSTSWSNYCTVPNNMISNIKLLESTNWNKVDEFVNHNSGNTVYLFNKKLDRNVGLSKILEFRNPKKYKSHYAKEI